MPDRIRNAALAHGGERVGGVSSRLCPRMARVRRQEREPVRWVGLAFIPLLAIIACAPAPGDLSRGPSHDRPRRHVQGPEAAEFAAYQARMQDLGLLRTDWDPKDAPYSNDQLERNFHRIAIFAFPKDLHTITHTLTRLNE